MNRVDLTSLVKDVTNSTLMQITEAVKEEWISQAKSNLNTTANKYIEGIKTRISLGSSPSAEVYLDTEFAKKYELGFPSYDMKPILKNSKNSKISEESGNWYAYIPFKHTTPSATGRQGKPMPNAVYSQARKLPMWGKLPSNTDLGVYSGMKKVPETQNGSRASYMTVRTVSENSPPDAFIHPGFEGVHIADNLSSQIEDTFAKMFQDNLGYAKDENRW